MTNKKNIFIVFLILIQLLSAQIIITEVMFDTAGNENNDEFVEIYNNSDIVIDISGWQISDDSETDILIKYNGYDNMLLEPHQYCVVMDSSYYLNSIYYESLIPDSVLRVMINDGSFGQYGLSNTINETITIYDPDSTAISSYTYLNDQDAGYSDERVDFNDNLWENSKFIDGTPGFKNSVSYFEHDIDVKLLYIPETVQINKVFKIDLIANNCGLNTLNNFLCEVSDQNSIIGSYEYNIPIPSNDSVEFNVDVKLVSSGINDIIVNIMTDIDDFLSNNQLDTVICAYNDNNDFSLNPKTVTPNSDGNNDVLTISYDFDSAFIYLTVKIYNVKGQQVALPANSIYSTAKNEFIWDCIDINGKIIDTGAYICFLSVKENDGKISKFKKAFYVIK